MVSETLTFPLFKTRELFPKPPLESVLKIQKLFRGFLARKKFKNLLYEKKNTYKKDFKKRPSSAAPNFYKVDKYKKI